MPLALDMCQSTHLSSPLVNENVIFILCHIQNIPLPQFANLTKNLLSHLNNVEEVQRNWRFEWNQVLLNPQCLLRKIFNKNIELPVPPRPSRTGFTRFLNLAVQNLMMQLPVMEQKCLLSVIVPHNLFQLIMSHEAFIQLNFLDDLRALLEQGVCLTAKASRQSRSHDLKCWKSWKPGKEYTEDTKNFYCNLQGRTRLWVDSEFMMIKIPSGQIWMGSRKHFLMFSDIISQRFLILLSSVIAEVLGKANYPRVATLNKIFDWGDAILENCGNEGYSLIKMWDSLCTGVMISSRTDPAVDSSLFLKNMQREFLSLEVKTPMYRAKVLNQLMEILGPLRSEPHVLSQLGGLFRIWGHPTVALISGLKKLRSVATVHRESNPAMVRLVNFKWREMFFLSYHRKHSIWPKFEFLPSLYNASSYLHQCLERNQPLNLTVKQYDLGDWEAIRFVQNFQVANKFSLSEMIADKATSLGYKELIHAIKHTQSIGSASDRSVIIRWLKDNLNDPLEFLSEIDRNGFDRDSGPVGVCAKEQEMSIHPRYFGLTPIRKRLYVVLTEAMLADNLLPYFPEITMTYDSTALLTKIHAQTREQNKNNSPSVNYHTVVVNIDFVKWNSYMRESETKGMFQDFDHLFGFTNLYGRTHEMFSGQLYLAMGVYLPEIDEENEKLKDSEIVWSDHLGGIEGLRQKGWTIFTVVILRMVSELTGVECSTMGQGDNQVLLCKYPIKDRISIQEQHEQFMSTLDLILEQIGPPLKPLETWSSSYYFAYGKYPVWDGEPLSLALKKVCKCMRLTNDGLQNLNSTLSSIAANAAAATYGDTDPIVPYLIGVMESAAAIQLGLENPFYSDQPVPRNMTEGKAYLSLPRDGKPKRFFLKVPMRLQNMVSKVDDDFLLILLNYPSILGGYPILMWNELVVHGFPDPLTLAINSVLNCVKYTKKNYLKDFFLKIVNPELSGEVNPEMICTDPFSLNLMQGSTASDKVKRMVFDFIAEQVDSNQYTNKVFLEFMQLAKTEQRDLCQVLYSADPFNSVLASSMVEATPIGGANKMMARVNKTNVLIRLMLSDRERKAVRAALKEEGWEQMEEEGSSKRHVNFYTLFGRFEQNYFHGMMYNLTYSHAGRKGCDSWCSFRRAEELRREGWQKPIEGVTTAFPLEMFFPVLEGIPNPVPSVEGLGFFQTQIIGRNSLPLNSVSGLGPFKPYFGNSTKNKVTYEARKLVPVAPPILKNLLELLCVPGWMTPLGSKLDQLIRMIFSSVTDLDVDSLVPSEDEIAGSFNHRRGSEKSKMKATMSVLWGWASYIISTSDHYRPENKNTDWDTDNLAINYQSVYLSLAFCLSLRLTITGIPQETITFRWYTECLDCINQVNESLIDLPDDVDLASIESLSQHKNNPYCWIPGDTLMKSTEEQYSMGTKIPLSSLDVSDFRKLLNFSVSQFIVANNYIVNSFNQNLNPLDYSQKPVPLIICFKSSLTSVIEILSDDLVLKFMFYSTCNQWFKLRNYNRWILSVLESVSQIPSHWYYSLKNYYASDASITEFQQTFPSIRLPEGSPPNKDQMGISFQKAIMSTIFHPMYLKSLEVRILERLNLPFSITDLYFLHPIFLTSVVTILKGQAIPIEVSFLGSFFDHYRTKSSTLPSTQRAPSWKELSFSSPSEGGHYFSVVLKVRSRNLKFIHFNMNALAERLPRIQVKDPEKGFVLTSSSLLSPLTHLDLLSQSTKTILTLNGIQETSSSFPETVYSIAQEFAPGPSIYPDNHYYKISPTSTSALYKLISLLKDEMPLLSSVEKESITVGCLADGSGGFAAVFSRIIPKCNVIYNTLRKFSEQNPDGTGFIFPASLSQFNLGKSRVLGLRLLECDKSDLLLKDTWESLCGLTEKTLIVTCDAEGAGWENPAKPITIAKGLSLFCHYQLTDLAILKGYVSDLFTSYVVCNILLCSFDQVKVKRSHFSSRGNTEVYYVASGRRDQLLNFPRYTWTSTDREVTGATSVEAFDYFAQSIQENKDTFYLGANDLEFRYTRFILRLNPSLEVKPDSWDLLRKTQFTGGDKAFNFPGPWIKVEREKYPLIRFTGYNPKNHRKSTLTKRVQNELATDLLIMSALCYRPDLRKQMLERFFEERETWWFFCSHSFDGHYTLGLKKGLDEPKFSLEISVQVASLLNNRSFQKVFSEVGKFNFYDPTLVLKCRFSPLIETWASLDVLKAIYEERTIPINYPLWAAPIRSFWELPGDVLKSLQLFNEFAIWDEYRTLPLSTIVKKAYKMRGVTVENSKKMKDFYKSILQGFLQSNYRGG